ncbi:hypothetical protein [Actinoplanes couchii]|uniref:hypothetical protein n=1 Tax=Actinoplanes couchii TaxID=403638 RepID=UPI0019441D10|nr:hypothetical protein [Actinoplanes couchii]MDR6324533.1 hypothetical protein [Actinoplanes couchii]
MGTPTVPPCRHRGRPRDAQIDGVWPGPEKPIPVICSPRLYLIVTAAAAAFRPVVPSEAVAIGWARCQPSPGLACCSDVRGIAGDRIADLFGQKTSMLGKRAGGD